MARVNYVKHARARFEMVPVTNEDGSVKQVPVLRADGTPKKTKRGKEIYRTLTVQDRTKPLPNYKCGKCGKEIEPGMPYKWIEPRSGPYGGRMMVRCADCPTWQVWEYSSSLSARIAQIQHNAGEALSADFDTPDDVTSILNDVAQEVRDLATEKQEAADNMESGFGHATYQSDELSETAQNLESWADDIEQADIPDLTPRNRTARSAKARARLTVTSATPARGQAR
jgi:hypothetical protein